MKIAETPGYWCRGSAARKGGTDEAEEMGSGMCAICGAMIPVDKCVYCGCTIVKNKEEHQCPYTDEEKLCQEGCCQNCEVWLEYKEERKNAAESK